MDIMRIIIKFNIKQLQTDQRLEKYKHLIGKKLIVFGGAWMPFLSSTKEKYNEQKKNEKIPLLSLKKTKRCTALFNSISISPTHYSNACCGLPIQYINYLRLGSTKKYSLKYLYEYQFQDFLKIWLFTEGPKKILDFCTAKRNIQSYNTDGWHICQICAEIFKDNENIITLQQSYGEVFSNVMFEYSLLRKEYLKLLT